MTVHAIRYKSLFIIYMSGSLPGIVSKLNFVTGCAELRCRGPHHCVITETEQRKCDDNSDNNKYSAIYIFFHFYPCFNCLS